MTQTRKNLVFKAGKKGKTAGRCAMIRCEPAGETLRAWASQSNHQGVLRQISVFAPEMLHLLFIPVSQITEPQAVLFRVHDGKQLCLQAPALAGIQQTFKHGILHPLAVIYAVLGDTPQPCFSGGIPAYTPPDMAAKVPPCRPGGSPCLPDDIPAHRTDRTPREGKNGCSPLW